MTRDGASPDTYPVQEILWWNEKLVSELYVRVLNGHVDIVEGNLELDGNAKISCNTYFNSFYESYWAECAPLDDLVLVIELKGEAVIEIYRDSPHLGCSKIEWRRVKSSDFNVHVVKIPIFSGEGEDLGSAVAEGRIFFDIQAKRQTRIRSASYRTTRPPRTTPAITLGICTFNREPYLYRNLKELVGLAEKNESLAKIIIVNQGSEFENPELKSLIKESDKLCLIEQGNLGGCGGFTRTMYESFSCEGATHHVLMDDDAHIDSRIISNLEYFISYLAKDVVIGGHMLDLYRPWMLYEAGAIIGKDSRIQRLHHDIDLRRLDALHPFREYHKSDYNAWWFCAIPIRHIRDVHFPAPIFIRGDDIEYGVRLQEQGVDTIAMPGIGVWHEPFYAKAGSWQVYYDYRNRLILSSMYPHRFNMDSPKIIAWAIFNALALHNYQEAALIIKAVEDFLLGPGVLAQGANELHEKVMEITKGYAPESIHRAQKLDRMHGSHPVRGEARIVVMIIRRIIDVIIRGERQKSTLQLFMDSDVNTASISNVAYVKTNGLDTYRLKYTPNRRVLLALVGRGVAMVMRYRKERGHAASTWIAEGSRLRDIASWERIFREDAVPGPH